MPRASLSKTPSAERARDRLVTVLDAIYAAFGLAWAETGGDARAGDLAAEAVTLGRLVAVAMPTESEAHGLLALMLFVESRRDARRDRAGAYVPLDAQDPTLWSRTMIDEAERTLQRAGTRAIGRFQLEAAIQSAHVARARATSTDWRAVALLYDALVANTDAVGALVARAAAHARAYGDAAGLRELDALDTARVASYQPYWAVRASLTGDARDYDRAIGLSEHAASRAFLVAARASRTPRVPPSPRD